MKTIIQGLWIGDTLGPLPRLSISSFLHFGAEYHLYCYGAIADVPDGVTLRDANEVLPASAIFGYESGPGRGSVAAFSNLFRYKLLLDRGGWWADCDVVCLNPFDFPEAVVLSSHHSRASFKLANAVMKLPRAHEVARLSYERAGREDRASLQWGQTGPDLLSLVVREIYSGQSIVRPPEVFFPLPWWHWDWLLSPDPAPCAALITPHTYAIHLWHEMWRRAGLNLGTGFPETCYFSQLVRRFGGDGRPQPGERQVS